MYRKYSKLVGNPKKQLSKRDGSPCSPYGKLTSNFWGGLTQTARFSGSHDINQIPLMAAPPLPQSWHWPLNPSPPPKGTSTKLHASLSSTPRLQWGAESLDERPWVVHLCVGCGQELGTSLSWFSQPSSNTPNVALVKQWRLEHTSKAIVKVHLIISDPRRIESTRAPGKGRRLSLWMPHLLFCFHLSLHDHMKVQPWLQIFFFQSLKCTVLCPIAMGLW
jgi:hypothetical protein